MRFCCRTLIHITTQHCLTTIHPSIHPYMRSLFTTHPHKAVVNNNFLSVDFPPLAIMHSFTHYTQTDTHKKLFQFSTSINKEGAQMDFSRPLSSSSSSLCFLIIILSGGSLLFQAALVGSIGINYGQIANNLPSPDKVVPLLKSIGATKVKLYDADSRVLCAFANTGIEFVVGLGNEYLSNIAEDPSAAQAWVKANVQAYLPATKITCITVGNEVLTFNDTSLSGCLYPAMQNIHTALANVCLDKQVSVTTAHSLAVLQTSYPPSSGAFRKDLKGCITQILNFHAKTGSSFLINAYPYFAYKASPKQVSLDYVLFQPNQGVLDPISNLKYDNMLFAQIDAVYTALASLGYKKMPVQISETGWPSKGDQDEVGATPENAKKYNENLIKMITAQKKGTPMRPDSNLDLYVFALFNENMKPGPTSERNYGLFKPDGTPSYQLDMITDPTSGGGGGGSGSGSGSSSSNSSGSSTSSSGNNSGSSSNNSNDGDNGQDSDNSPNGFLSISSAMDELRSAGQLLVSACLSWMLLLFLHMEM